MAFVSYVFTREEVEPDRYIYTITDSDFGEAEVVVEGRWLRVGFGVVVGVGIAVAKEYSKRGLNVGRNLALFVIYYHKRYGDGIADLKGWQDEYCGPIIENWTQYAAERDEHLAKLLTLI